MHLNAGGIEDSRIMKILKAVKDFFGAEKRESTGTNSIRTNGRYALPSALLGGTPLNIATVYRCVTFISQSVANLPLRYMKKKGDVFVEDETNRLSYLLNVQPDEAYNAFDFWAQAVQQMLLYGNAYIVPVYNPILLEVSRLVLCGNGAVSHDTLNNTYTVCDTLNALNGTFQEDEIIHIKNLSIDGKNGLSTLGYANLTLNIAAAGDRETLTRFTSGGNVRGLICNQTGTHGFGEYPDKQLENVAEDIDEKVYGGKRFINIPGQVDFKQFSLSSTDMQFLESRKFSVREICRFFGVHPSFVFDDTSNNYKDAEMSNVAFLSNTLNPILRKIENELQRKLINREDVGTKKFQFDRRGLYACDLDSRIKYQTQTIAAGLYSVNDWREIENMPKVEGGDKIFVSANLKGLDDDEAKTE